MFQVSSFHGAHEKKPTKESLVDKNISETPTRIETTTDINRQTACISRTLHARRPVYEKKMGAVALIFLVMVSTVNAILTPPKVIISGEVFDGNNSTREARYELGSTITCEIEQGELKDISIYCGWFINSANSRHVSLLIPRYDFGIQSLYGMECFCIGTTPDGERTGSTAWRLAFIHHPTEMNISAFEMYTNNGRFSTVNVKFTAERVYPPELLCSFNVSSEKYPPKVVAKRMVFGLRVSSKPVLYTVVCEVTIQVTDMVNGSNVFTVDLYRRLGNGSFAYFHTSDPSEPIAISVPSRMNVFLKKKYNEEGDLIGINYTCKAPDARPPVETITIKCIDKKQTSNTSHVSLNYPVTEYYRQFAGETCHCLLDHILLTSKLELQWLITFDESDAVSHKEVLEGATYTAFILPFGMLIFLCCVLMFTRIGDDDGPGEEQALIIGMMFDDGFGQPVSKRRDKDSFTSSVLSFIDVHEKKLRKGPLVDKNISETPTSIETKPLCQRDLSLEGSSVDREDHVANNYPNFDHINSMELHDFGALNDPNKDGSKAGHSEHDPRDEWFDRT